MSVYSTYMYVYILHMPTLQPPAYILHPLLYIHYTTYICVRNLLCITMYICMTTTVPRVYTTIYTIQDAYICMNMLIVPRCIYVYIE